MTNTINIAEPIETITTAKEHLNEFMDKIKIEEKKYPITERENILIDAIKDVYDILDRVIRYI